MARRNILITGASRGIGEQLALIYAEEGVNLILLARDRDRLSAVAQRCLAKNARVLTQCIDCSDDISLKNFIVEIDEQYPIDLVIANAGVSCTLSEGWQMEDESLREEVLRVNVQGSLATINPLINRMIKRKSGQIVFMSSLAALRGLPQSPSYCASKAYLSIYAQSLRAWLKRYNIHVSVIYPGYVDTDMSRKLSGPKPLLLSSEKAAQVIKKGLSRNKACIAFPRPLYWLTRMSHLLPAVFVNYILNRYESCVS
ncbi:SDR family NAD(P)-dependent oxidoreductase [Legionella massiliensis]|nr:SDR family NAD(P)-dependent oxidoreductase [Legionella massiliensis]